MEAVSDLQLLDAVRSGSVEAFGTLWSRHESAARVLARQIAAPREVDDLVSESFLRVLRSLRDGKGPQTAFRAYMLSTLRRVNIDTARRYHQRVVLAGDARDLDPTSSPSSEDVAVERSDQRLAWAAWASLPDDVRSLLWRLVVDEQTPAQLAESMGTTPNGVASRAKRARERLRQAFVTVHLADASEQACRDARSKLAAYVRSSLSPRDRASVDDHLDRCPGCRAALVAAVDVGQAIRTHVVPLVAAGAVVGAALQLGEGAAGGTAATSSAAATASASSTAASSVATASAWVIGSKAVAVSVAAMAAIVGGVSLNSDLNDTAAPSVPLSATSSPSSNRTSPPSSKVTTAPSTSSVPDVSPASRSTQPSSTAASPGESQPTATSSAETQPTATSSAETQPTATSSGETQPTPTRSTSSSPVATTTSPQPTSPRDSFSPPPITSAPTQPPELPTTAVTEGQNDVQVVSGRRAPSIGQSARARPGSRP